MKFACLLIVAVVAGAYAEPQPQFNPQQYPQHYQPQQYQGYQQLPQQYGGYYPDQYNNYFRAQAPYPSFDKSQPQQSPIAPAQDQEGRFFFTTLTVTLATSTATSTTTSTTTCTISTAALSVCTQSGRRRRGANLERAGRDLFYSEKEEENEEGSIFLPVPAKPVEEVAPVAEAERTPREQLPTVPFVVQPGFQAPGDKARFLLAYGTSTVTATSTATATLTLTATCQSTTSFATCGSSLGK